MSYSPLIVANWKMNLLPSEEVLLWSSLVKRLHGHDVSDLELVVAPSHLSLSACAGVDSSFALCAQDVHWSSPGAVTGEISCEALEEVGCRYAIVGHSERRNLLHENSVMVAQKFAAVYASSLTPILCIGESSEVREQGSAVDFLCDQLAFLQDIAFSSDKPLIVAYEPVWAISTSSQGARPATPHDVSEVREQLSSFFDSLSIPAGIRFLYGGSVTKESALSFVQPDIADGILIGGASQEVDSFSELILSFVS